MPHEGPNIYDYLAKYKVSELTVELLDSATKNTAITPENLEFWRNIIAVSRILDDSRTYSHGLVIPETGAVEILTIANSANETITPTGTEIWRVENIHLSNCSIALKDEDGNQSAISLTAPAGGMIPVFSVPFYISATLGILFQNDSGGSQTPSIAYHKVSF